MKKQFTLIILLFAIVAQCHAQQLIKGKVQDDKGAPIAGASVSLDNTLDGATSDTAGNFTLSTTEKGQQTLVITAVGFEAINQPIKVEDAVAQPFSFKLKNVANTLQQAISVLGKRSNRCNDSPLTFRKGVNI